MGREQSSRKRREASNRALAWSVAVVVDVDVDAVVVEAVGTSESPGSGRFEVAFTFGR